MSRHDQADEQWGVVREALPSLRFKVVLDTGAEVIAYLAGRMHKNFIRVLAGDRVKVYCPPNSAVCRLVHRPRPK